MQSLYFTRHGETVWNVENKICGVTDIPLTDRGRAQARALGRRLAAETGLPLTVEPRLREQAFGRYEGTPRNGAAFALAKLHFIDRFDGGESMLQLAARIYALLDELRGQDGPVLLVAHNGIARVVQSYFHDMTNEQFALFGIANCELRRYDFST